MARNGEVALGCKAKDSITNLTGIVVAITKWLNGCERITIQPQELKDGRPVDGCTFDVEQVEVVQPAVAPIGKPSGGPSISPVRNADPK